MDDFSIDSFAFIPGVPLDPSQMGYAASLATQQCIEMAYGSATEAATQAIWDELLSDD